MGNGGPEALAGGAIGKRRDGDRIHIAIARKKFEGSVDYVGDFTAFLRRPLRDDLAPATQLPDDTRLWAALQATSGGTWGGCVFDVEEIMARLKSSEAAPAPTESTEPIR